MKHKRKKFFKENIIILLLTILTEIISILFIRPRIFTGIIESKFSYWLINIVFIIFLPLIYKMLFFFAHKIKKKESFYINLLKHSIIYFIFMFIILLIIYPGTWFYDEFWIVSYATNYSLSTWQSYLSVIIYTIVFYIIPHPIGLTLFQLIIISLIMGYAHSKIQKRYHNKIFNVILHICFLTPVFLINNSYLLRAILYTYIVLLFYTIIIFDYLEKIEITKIKIFVLLFLSFIMINWRSEGIIFLICNPICIFITYKNIFNIQNIIKMCIALFIPMMLYTKINSDKMYTATTTIIPLSIMLNQNLQGEHLKSDLENIDKVFDLDVLKKYPNYHFMQCYWDDNVCKSDFYANLDKYFYISFGDLVINNFDKFLDVRWKIFLYTFNDTEYPNNCYLSYINNSPLPNLPNFIVGSVINKFNLYPINLDLKLKVENLLMKNNIIKILFWNLIPLIIFIILIFTVIKKLFQKEWLLLILISALFMKMFITFFTATASYYMYYFTEYTVGLYIILLLIFETIANKKNHINTEIVISK